MADEEKIGKPWQDDELDAIIADYFFMLEAELAVRPYVKAHHSAELMEQMVEPIGPSNSSTKIFPPYSMNWDCLGYRDTNPSGTIKPRFSTPLIAISPPIRSF